MQFFQHEKIGLIGDVHAEDILLEATLKHFQCLGTSKILCVGDIVDGPGDVNRTCDLLRDYRVICVRGNHDRWCMAGDARNLPMAHDPEVLSPVNKGFLLGLPLTVHFRSPLGGFLLCHALGENDMIKIKPDIGQYDIDNTDELQELFADPHTSFVIGGHSHVPMVKKFDQLTIINPGTLYRDHSPGCAMVDMALAEVVFWKFSNGPSHGTEVIGLQMSSTESIACGFLRSPT